MTRVQLAKRYGVKIGFKGLNRMDEESKQEIHLSEIEASSTYLNNEYRPGKAVDYNKRKLRQIKTKIGPKQ